MTIKAAKEILAKKLKDENTYFTKSDISIRKSEHIRKGDTCKDYTYKIVIKDYEHITFVINIRNNHGVDPYICVYYKEDDFQTMIIYDDFHGEKDLENVLIKLGYFIGTRFWYR